MRVYTFKVGVGAVEEIAAAGNYVRIRSITGGSAINLRIINDKNNEEAELSQGDDCEFSDFGSLRISHDAAAEQTIKLMVSKNRKSGSAQIGGSVAAAITGSVTTQPLAMAGCTQTQRTVTMVSGQILNGWGNRRWLMIQNKHATGTIWIRLSDGTGPATQASGIRIGPGESFTVESSVGYSGLVQAIGDIASNDQIVTAEIGN